uniref:Uncharacterized protein n=1 Tax=Oryza rufipogon TaxID=4529 RepID=A0A0E0R078_ORYRU
MGPLLGRMEMHRGCQAEGRLDRSTSVHGNDGGLLFANPCGGVAGVGWSRSWIWGPEPGFGHIAPPSRAAMMVGRSLSMVPSHLHGAPHLLDRFTWSWGVPYGKTVKMATGKEGRGCQHVAVGGGHASSLSW